MIPVIPFFKSKRLGIDLGTSNCLVWASGEGVVLAEPSVVAVDAVSGKVVAVGSEAREMLGRTGPPRLASGEAGSNLIAQKPLRDGVVADFLVAQAMLKYFMTKALGTARLMRPEVMVCVPSGITQVERRAVLEAALTAGAKTAYLIDQSLAAAIGAKLPIEAAFGSMVVDIGGGQVGAAVVSLGGTVASASAKAGGAKIDEAIGAHLRRAHNLIIGERMAEDIKIKIGAALLMNPKKTMEVRGRDAILGLPKTVVVDSHEITGAIGPVLASIVTCIKNVLEQTPPELASDIIERGMVLTGGTAQLRALDRLISSQTNVPAPVSEDPMHAVVYGTGMALENIDSWRRLLHTR
ncbi:rod shape-determining protein [Candidatus Curtissbacteria bacterium]|nr:rod shape-determining protein [Candidatus Curtissbacteria bacterium]